jgi:prevent-host-death family protein
MKSWQLQEARSRFKDLLDEVVAGEPQRITRRGRDAVVVISEKDWKSLVGAVPSWGTLLTSLPVTARELPRRRPARALRRPPFA